MKFYLSLYFTFLSEPWPLELELDSYFMAKRDFVKRRVAFINETHPSPLVAGCNAGAQKETTEIKVATVVIKETISQDHHQLLLIQSNIAWDTKS